MAPTQFSEEEEKDIQECRKRKGSRGDSAKGGCGDQGSALAASGVPLVRCLTLPKYYYNS